jgi:hypothetical protein
MDKRERVPRVKRAMLAALASASVGGCAVVPVASITNIDTEDVTVQVSVTGMLATATPEAIQQAAQREGDRGCGRYDTRATMLSSHLVQSGNDYNGWRTVYQFIFTCG